MCQLKTPHIFKITFVQILKSHTTAQTLFQRGSYRTLILYREMERKKMVGRKKIVDKIHLSSVLSLITPLKYGIHGKHGHSEGLNKSQQRQRKQL